ncbi:hypothetical protein [Shewanella livingstonensis]|nr:hypothetical protein [Shewanella livingstonensis]
MRFDIVGLNDVKDQSTMKQAGRDIVNVLQDLVQKKQATKVDLQRIRS